MQCYVLDPTRRYKTSRWFDPGYWVCKTDKDGKPQVFELEYVEPSELSFQVTMALETAGKWKNPVNVRVEDGRILAVGQRFRTDKQQIIIKTKGGRVVFDSEAQPDSMGESRARKLGNDPKPRTTKRPKPVEILPERGQATLPSFIYPEQRISIKKKRELDLDRRLRVSQRDSPNA